MVCLQIAFKGRGDVPGIAQEPGVFAGAVVMDSAWPVPIAHQYIASVIGIWIMGAAAEVRICCPYQAQPRADPAYMHGLARMRRTGQRQVLGGEPKSIRGAAFDERQCLDHLDGRPREHHSVGVAPLRDQAPR